MACNSSKSYFERKIGPLDFAVRHGRIALEIEIEKYFRLLIPQGLKPHEEDHCSYPNKANF